MTQDEINAGRVSNNVTATAVAVTTPNGVHNTAISTEDLTRKPQINLGDQTRNLVGQRPPEVGRGLPALAQSERLVYRCIKGDGTKGLKCSRC